MRNLLHFLSVFRQFPFLLLAELLLQPSSGTCFMNFQSICVAFSKYQYLQEESKIPYLVHCTTRNNLFMKQRLTVTLLCHILLPNYHNINKKPESISQQNNFCCSKDSFSFGAQKTTIFIFFQTMLHFHQKHLCHLHFPP